MNRALVDGADSACNNKQVRYPGTVIPNMSSAGLTATVRVVLCSDREALREALSSTE